MEQSALKELSGSLRGRLLLSGYDGYTTAFAHRKSIANMFAVVDWPVAESRNSHVRYIKEYWKSFEPFTDGWYTNEVDDHAVKKVNGNYQGNFERLLKVKNQYDPTNLFRLNTNVKPSV